MKKNTSRGNIVEYVCVAWLDFRNSYANNYLSESFFLYVSSAK